MYIGFFIAFVYTLVVFVKRPPSLHPTLYPFMYKGSIVLPISPQYAIHMHHWIYCSLIAAVCYSSIPDDVLTFLISMSVQGIRHTGAFDILVKNPYK